MGLPELPPLPVCLVETDLKVNGEWVHEALFVTADMRAYALEAVAAERERCAQIAARKAEAVARVNTYRGKVNSASVHAIGMLEDVAAAIRAQGSKT